MLEMPELFLPWYWYACQCRKGKGKSSFTYRMDQSQGIGLLMLVNASWETFEASAMLFLDHKRRATKLIRFHLPVLSFPDVSRFESRSSRRHQCISDCDEQCSVETSGSKISARDKFRPEFGTTHSSFPACSGVCFLSAWLDRRLG